MKSTKILRSFLPVSSESHFPIQNLPFGVFQPNESSSPPRCATRIGEQVVDLSVLESQGVLDGPLFGELYKQNKKIFSESSLNSFIALDWTYWSELRATLQKLFEADSPFARESSLLSKIVIPVKDVEMVIPTQIGDFTDFHSSKYHAFNVGSLLRGQKQIPTNWLRLPLGYPSRTSCIVPSGTKIPRPRGQVKIADQDESEFTTTTKLDFELEVGTILGGRFNDLGKPIHTKDAYHHIFGYVLMNDWTCRDFQTWEYVPLGALTAKNFRTSISSWIVSFEAMREFRVRLSLQDYEPLSYLKDKEMIGYDFNLESAIKTKKAQEYQILSQTNMRYQFWSTAQQIAHHTVSGCNLRPSDLFGSGAMSGPGSKQLASLIEMSQDGDRPLKLSTGEKREFLEDEDSVKFSGYQKSKDGYTIGFGECEGTILPANKYED